MGRISPSGTGPTTFNFSQTRVLSPPQAADEPKEKNCGRRRGHSHRTEWKSRAPGHRRRENWLGRFRFLLVDGAFDVFGAGNALLNTVMFGDMDCRLRRDDSRMAQFTWTCVISAPNNRIKQDQYVQRITIMSDPAAP